MKQLTDKVSGQNVSILRAEGKVRQDADNVSVPTARQQGRAQEAAVGLERLIREGEELTAKANALDNKLRDMEALHDAVALFQDRQAMMSLGVLIGAATMVMVAKDVINGRDPAERFKEENMTKTMYELFDRSGLLGWTSPYADSALKLTGLGGGNRYSRNGWAESLLGINFALFQDVQKTGTALFSDSPDKARKLLTVVPFAMHARLLGRFVNQLTN